MREVGVAIFAPLGRFCERGVEGDRALFRVPVKSACVGVGAIQRGRLSACEPKEMIVDVVRLPLVGDTSHRAHVVGAVQESEDMAVVNPLVVAL